MLNRRSLTSIIKRCHSHLIVRNCSKSIKPGSLIRQVHPYSNIKITSNYHLDIKPYDLLDCPDGNLLRVSLKPLNHGPSTKLSNDIEKFINEFKSSIEIDDKMILIDTQDQLNKQSIVQKFSNDLICVIEIPVKSNLKVLAHRDVFIQNLYSDDINIMTSDGNITTKNIHSININLNSEHGNIRCDGSTLAQKFDARTYGDKGIHLQKTLGDRITAITENGIISTDSCYSENSKFITQKGELQLKNVHKRSELYVLDGGRLNVTGFHGILRAKTKCGHLQFQLTEIYGDSCIEAIDPITFNVNLSEFVEQHTCLSIEAKTININENLKHFNENQIDCENGKRIEIGNRDLIDDQLKIQTNGHLELGKMSWMDTVKLKFGASTEKTLST